MSNAALSTQFGCCWRTFYFFSLVLWRFSGIVAFSSSLFFVVLWRPPGDRRTGAEFSSCSSSPSPGRKTIKFLIDDDVALLNEVVTAEDALVGRVSQVVW